MIKFKPIENDELLLKLSPLVRAIDLTLNYINAQNGIELTKGMAFNRKFIHWAAKEFQWLGHSYEELFQIQKVLNEPDFPVCKAIHILLLQTKVGRHFKGKFLLTGRVALSCRFYSPCAQYMRLKKRHESVTRPFFKTIKAELIWRHTWQTRRQAEIAIFEYINGFYNPRRRHSALGWKSPLAFERMAA